MDCICERLKKDEREYISHGDWNSLLMERDEYGEYYIVAVGDGNAYLRINYCLKCGRKLSEE